MLPLFVYGTLKNGCSNHNLLRGAEFLGNGRVWGYTLIVDVISYAVRAPVECSVTGELYWVTDTILDRVDRPEGHPDAYRRVVVEVETGSARIRAWMYEWPHGRVDRCLAEEYRC